MSDEIKEEFDELKKSLNFLSGEIAAVVKQQEMIMEMMGEIRELKKQNGEKDVKIAHLECRVDDLEQYSRMNDLIVSGLETRHRSYARAVATRASSVDTSESELQTLEEQVVAFFVNKGMPIDSKDIEGCHSLPSKDKKTKPTIIIRFTSRKKKIVLLKQGKKLKGSNVYINEHLTRKNADIARKARFLRKTSKIQSTWTNNCKVFIKLNGTPEEARVLVIRDMTDLEKYN